MAGVYDGARSDALQLFVGGGGYHLAPNEDERLLLPAVRHHSNMAKPPIRSTAVKRFNFLQPSAIRKDHPIGVDPIAAVDVYLKELVIVNGATNATSAVNCIPLEHIMSVIPSQNINQRHQPQRPIDDSNTIEVAGNVSPPSWSDSPARHQGGADPHHDHHHQQQQEPTDRKHRFQRKRNSVSLSTESQQLADKVQRMSDESNQIVRAHMELRRRNQVERQSFEEYEALCRQHAKDWESVCDSTVTLNAERKAVENLYRTPIRSLLPPMAVGSSPQRQPQQRPEMDSHTPQRRQPSHLEPMPNRTSLPDNSMPPAGEFVSRSSLLIINDIPTPSLPRLHRKPDARASELPEFEREVRVMCQAPYPPDDPRQFKSPQSAYRSPMIVHRSTQDVIQAMERRYQLEMEKEQRKAEQQVFREGRIQRVDEEKAMANRHAAFQHRTVERRREEAKRRAVELEAIKREETKLKIANQEMQSVYAQWRSGIDRRSNNAAGGQSKASLAGFSGIARRNEVLVQC